MIDPTPIDRTELVEIYDQKGNRIGTETRPLEPHEVEQRRHRNAVATEFVQFRDALDALTAIPNNAFDGAREVKAFARATRRMLRATVRELREIDNSPGQIGTTAKERQHKV